MPTTAARATRAPGPTPVAPPEDRLHRFTVGQYQEMVRVGVLREDDRCELIHGVIVEKMPPNPPHAKAARRVVRRLLPLFADDRWVPGGPQPIVLTDSQPEPDFVVALGPEDRYDGRHPGPKEVALVIEVSDSSLGFDTSTKLALYAGHKIPQYWIVSIPDRQVEIYTAPRGGKNPTYRTRTDYGPGDSVPVVVAGQALGVLPVSELLP